VSSAVGKFKDAVLQPEREDAERRRADTAYWGDTAHWVTLAIVAVDRAIDRVPPRMPLSDWLAAVAFEIEDAAQRFREDEEDPDGYGIATFHGCLDRVRRFQQESLG
jgi:hypothetical protein